MSDFLIKPIVIQTWRWMWRASTVRAMIAMSLIAAFFPEDAAFQSLMLWIPLMVGSQGVGAAIRQDFTDLILCRPVKRYQFVLSKWAAYVIVPLLGCTLHAIYSLANKVSPEYVATTFLAVSVSGFVAAAAGTVCRMIILDPNRQAACLLVVMIFGLAMAVDTGYATHIAFVRNVLFPTSFAADALPTLELTAMLAALANIAVLLLIACLIVYRQEFSYAMD